MARFVVGTYMVRYPLGGMLSCSLQWALGLQALGHEVYLVEKSGWPGSCFDPASGVMSDDCTSGLRTVRALLSRFGLEERFCFVDATGTYHGLGRPEVEQVFRTADAFLDSGSHGAWLEEASQAATTVYIDGEPGFRQMKMELAGSSGTEPPRYEHWFTVGRNIGTPASAAPTAGKPWRPVFPPVRVGPLGSHDPPAGAAFTTVMNWRAHAVLEFGGRSYGQKNVEFERFFELPRLVLSPLEVAADQNAPRKRLEDTGWATRDAHEVTLTFDSYWSYIEASRGEFSVCKNVFVATWSGWFSDRSASYLERGRPVVLQDTGFSAHLPCGEGLFAVRDVDEAADAIGRIERDWRRHSQAARAIALEYLDGRKVMRGLLDAVGV